MLKNDVYVFPEKLSYYRVVEGSLSDSSKDLGVTIRTYFEQEEILYEIIDKMDSSALEKIYKRDDSSETTQLDLKCKKIKMLLEFSKEKPVLDS